MFLLAVNVFNISGGHTLTYGLYDTFDLYPHTSCEHSFYVLENKALTEYVEFVMQL